MGTIRIPALGRQVRLGDLYNVDTNDIIPSDILSPKDDRNVTRTHTPDGSLGTQVNFFTGQWEESKRHFLRVAALDAFATEQSDGARRLNELLDRRFPADHAKVVVRFEAFHRTEALGDHLIDSALEASSSPSMQDDQFIIQQVVFGGQAVVVLCQRIEDGARRRLFQDELFLAAKEIFTSLKTSHAETTYPEILDGVACHCYTDIGDRSTGELSFREYLDVHRSIFSDKQPSSWVEQELVLRPGSRSSRKSADFLRKAADLNAKYLTAILTDAREQAKQMVADTFLERVPHLKRRVDAFCQSLSQTVKGLEKSEMEDGTEIDQVFNFYVPQGVLTEWIAKRRLERNKFADFLAATEVEMASVAEVVEKAKSFRSVQIFHLKAESVTDALLAEMNKRNAVEQSATFEKFQLVSHSSEHFEQTRRDFLSLVNRHRKNPSVLVIITCGSPYPDGTCSQLPKRLCAPPSGLNRRSHATVRNETVKRMKRQHSPVPSENDSLPGSSGQAEYPPRSNSKSSEEVTTSSRGDPPRGADGNSERPVLTPGEAGASREAAPDQHGPVTRSRARASAASSGIYDTQSTANPTEIQEGDIDKLLDSLTIKDKRQEEEQDFIVIEESKTFDSLYQGERDTVVALSFLRRSKLHKEGQPSVYFLESNEKLSSRQQLRWFDIGLRDDSVPHKTILLMGATGSGKSTLVDAMVNYILGVDWGDAFRFKIVPEEVKSSQAQSQTTCITAYTIHHTKGFQIPYSITIIDTPGFGDTGGLGRDQQISRMICDFLSHSETGMDSIDAVCFVASSADTRLTPTQDYIINSVLSIFGSDIKENIRLLATFSDGSLPPLLEACAKANFPLLGDANGRYTNFNKFNNSVLFVRNDDNDQTVFDKAFWTMAASNFKLFFQQLEKLPPKSLSQTKKVIATRMQLEEKQKMLDRQLLVYLQKIDELQRDRQVSRELALKAMQRSRDNRVLVPVPMPASSIAYNCNKCQATCEIVPKSSVERSPHRNCRCRVESCLKSDHEYQNFKWEERSKEEQAEIDEACQGSIADKIARTEKELVAVKNAALHLFADIASIGHQLNRIGLRSSTTSLEDYVAALQSRLKRDVPDGYQALNDLLNELLLQWNTGQIFFYSSSSAALTHPPKPNVLDAYDHANQHTKSKRKWYNPFS